MATKRYLSLIGSSAISMQCGALNVWGVLLPYLASYFQAHDPSFTYSTLSAIICCIMSFEGLGWVLHLKVIELIGMKGNVLLGSTLMSIAFLCGAIFTNGFVFMIVFACLFGFGLGLTLLTVVNVASSHFPNYKGRVSGVCSASFGIGPIFYTIVAALCCNPHNESPVPHEGEGNDQFTYFGKDVYERIPFTMVMLTILSVAFGLIGVFTISAPKKLTSVQPDEEEIEPLLMSPQAEATPDFNPTYMDIIKTKRFPILFLQMFSCMWYSVWVIITFKSYGSIYIKDDAFLIEIGVIASIANCFARFLFPALMDYFDFRTLNNIVLPFQIFLNLVICYTVTSPYLYMLFVTLTYIVNGATFYPLGVAANTIYGRHGPKAFSLIAWGAVLASFSPTFLFHVFVENYGYFSSYMCCVIFSVLALTSNWLLKMHPEWPPTPTKILD